MVGGGFQHDICSSALNKNKFVEWDKSGSSNISIHIDDGLRFAVDKSKKKLWMVSRIEFYHTKFYK